MLERAAIDNPIVDRLGKVAWPFLYLDGQKASLALAVLTQDFDVPIDTEIVLGDLAEDPVQAVAYNVFDETPTTITKLGFSEYSG